MRGRSFRVIHPGLARAIDSIWVVPFFLFCIVFEIIPIIVLIKDSFIGPSGAFTLVNYAGLKRPVYMLSFWNSIRLSAITALFGTLFGTFIGYGILKTKTMSPTIQRFIIPTTF